MAHHMHDKVFKQIFSEPSQAISFLKGCLPVETLNILNLNSLVQVEGISYIYILLEHKSYAEQSTPLQILNYMVRVRIWRKHEEYYKTSILPHTIPILSYHVLSWIKSVALGTFPEKRASLTPPCAQPALS